MSSGVQVIAGERKRTRRGVRAEARVQRQRGEHGEQCERRERRDSSTSSDEWQTATEQRQLWQRDEHGERRESRNEQRQRGEHDERRQQRERHGGDASGSRPQAAGRRQQMDGDSGGGVTHTRSDGETTSRGAAARGKTRTTVTPTVTLMQKVWRGQRPTLVRREMREGAGDGDRGAWGTGLGWGRGPGPRCALDRDRTLGIEPTGSNPRDRTHGIEPSGSNSFARAWGGFMGRGGCLGQPRALRCSCELCYVKKPALAPGPPK